MRHKDPADKQTSNVNNSGGGRLRGHLEPRSASRQTLDSHEQV